MDRGQRENIELESHRHNDAGGCMSLLVGLTLLALIAGIVWLAKR